MANVILDLTDLANLLGRSPEQLRETSVGIALQFPRACISLERGFCDGAGSMSMLDSQATSSRASTRQTTNSIQANQVPNPSTN